MTLDDLRAVFHWLGPGTGSYITALDGDTATVKVIQEYWHRNTAPYEEAVAADFAKLGLKVKWKPFWSETRQKDIDAAREIAVKAGEKFDESAFVEKKRREGR